MRRGLSAPVGIGPSWIIIIFTPARSWYTQQHIRDIKHTHTLQQCSSSAPLWVSITLPAAVWWCLLLGRSPAPPYWPGSASPARRLLRPRRRGNPDRFYSDPRSGPADASPACKHTHTHTEEVSSRWRWAAGGGERWLETHSMLSGVPVREHGRSIRPPLSTHTHTDKHECDLHVNTHVCHCSLQ